MMHLKEVINSADSKQFLELPAFINRGNQNYIHPLNSDIESVFDRSKNAFFKKGDGNRWNLYDAKGDIIGRIAAFYHFDEKRGENRGGFGFFECIDEQEAANLLFDQAKTWLQANGLNHMEGPINFGTRDHWWGLLIEGFYPPVYGMFYHPPYYQLLFKQYSFEVLFEQYTYRRKISAAFSPAVLRRAGRIQQDPNYRFEDISGLSENELVTYFIEVYNAAWRDFDGVNALSRAEVAQLITHMRPAIDKKIIWFSYFKDQPIGFFINLPDLNQLLVKFLRQGSLNICQKIRFLYRKTTRKCTTMVGMVFGIHPDYQGRGVESALIVNFANSVSKLGPHAYQEIQMNWIGSFNTKMIAVVESLGAERYKTHCTYRLTF
ncbi:hypothetical protein [Sphingobacterium sp.]|uniref:hypothetical protein n=1 Tax=Sphingobacterium sp. TaxID=341027 RepID=UPI00289EA692|nr:hypothetical protein [Sphingobacterium sp.]